jgi:integrase/recombinase XerC
MESRGDKALVTDDAHATLYQAAPDYFKPFLMLLYLTGARPGEVAAITADNFDEGNGLVRLKDHKTARHGGKPRLIFLSPEALAILREPKAKYGDGHLLRNRYGLPYTKNAVVHLMARLRDKTGVKATAYFYRHSFATAGLANGVPDAQVAALMGHSGTAMLHRHYAHLTAQSQALKEALNRVR